MKILLLGTGLQGKAALHDLVNSPAVAHVTAADVNDQDLNTYVSKLDTDKVTTLQLDVRNLDQVSKLMAGMDAVITLLPKDFRLGMARLAVARGVHFVETSYTMPEYAELGVEAASKSVTLLPEFGLDPGIDLVLAGRAIKELDEVQELHAYGTGVPEPKAANNPLKYKISWTFAGVLSAYQRPARMLKDGQVIELTPSQMFDEEYLHHVDIEDVGLMEAYYNGDAVKYLDILGIKESTRTTGRYTLRWPGHAEFWQKIFELGFLQEQPIHVGDAKVSPRQFLHDLLSPQLQYQPDERDIAAIRIDVRGIKDGKRKRIIYQMVDWRDLETGLLAMQRTVGYTASIGAQMILRGDIQKRGLIEPGNDVPSEVLLAELEKRGITIKRFEMDW